MSVFGVQFDKLTNRSFFPSLFPTIGLIVSLFSLCSDRTKQSACFCCSASPVVEEKNCQWVREASSTLEIQLWEIWTHRWNGHLKVRINDGLELNVGDDLGAEGSDELGPLRGQPLPPHQPHEMILHVAQVDVVQTRHKRWIWKKNVWIKTLFYW